MCITFILLWFNMIWQTYISNNERIVHLKPRPSIYKSKASDRSPEPKSKESNLSARLKSGGTTCEKCGKHIQDERNRFCSITCKVTSTLLLNGKVLLFISTSLVAQIMCYCCQISLLPIEPQSQGPIHHSQRSSIDSINKIGRCTITQKPETIDFTMTDNHNSSEPESSISEAEPCGWVEVVNFRKRPRKTIPQRPLFVFISQKLSLSLLTLLSPLIFAFN